MGVFPQTVNIWAKLSLPLVTSLHCLYHALMSFYSFCLKSLYSQASASPRYRAFVEHTTDLCVSIPSRQFLGLPLLSNTIWHSWSLLLWSCSFTSFPVAFITIWFCWLFILASETVSSFSKDLVYSCHCLEQWLIQNRYLIRFAERMTVCLRAAIYLSDLSHLLSWSGCHSHVLSLFSGPFIS